MEKKRGKVISGRNGTAARHAEVRAVREPVAARWAEISGRRGRARHRRRDDRCRDGDCRRRRDQDTFERLRRRSGVAARAPAEPAARLRRRRRRGRRHGRGGRRRRGRGLRGRRCGRACRRDALIVEERRRHSAERLPICERVRSRRKRSVPLAQRAARRIVVPGGHRRVELAHGSLRAFRCRRLLPYRLAPAREPRQSHCKWAAQDRGVRGAPPARKRQTRIAGGVTRRVDAVPRRPET